MKIVNITQIGLGFLLLLFTACKDEEAKMGKGFVLPKGDVEQGKQAFAEMECHQCHSVAGEVFPELSEPSKVRFHLGGEVRKVKTYGELVTSVINPEHVVSKDYLETLEEDEREDAESPMPSMNDRMSVQQMIDIVEFLNAHYVKTVPDYEMAPYLPSIMMMHQVMHAVEQDMR